ncbi:TadE family type IV pilus minor pilin [Streptomyces sp. NBC_01089]|uniref:TadE family type IV pilus minor pilin n=1 Tax=Streptomyces sp. NBC_01089 TaxID=2903747 RepID=UPI00387021A2|nr:pilus assembly protein [Streptomyces sp. NBC_01089]
MRSSDAEGWPAGGGEVSGRQLGWGAADRGSVSAEAAVVIPALVLFTMTLVWALTAAAAQIQCVDAARAGARAAARSEPRAAAVAAARSAAPRGARVTMDRAGELWRVRVEAPTPGPGPLSLTLKAEAAALDEAQVSGPGTSGPPGTSGAPDAPDEPGSPGDATGSVRAAGSRGSANTGETKGGTRELSERAEART